MKTVRENGAASGISWASMRRVVDSLGVKKTKCAQAWYWSPPYSTGQGAQHAQLLNVEYLGQVEQLEPKNTASVDAKTDDCEVL